MNSLRAATDREAFQRYAHNYFDNQHDIDIAWNAWKAATSTERSRCEQLVLDLPMKQSGMYWNEHCKSFAFFAATCIKAPEIFDQDFNVRTSEANT